MTETRGLRPRCQRQTSSDRRDGCSTVPPWRFLWGGCEGLCWTLSPDVNVRMVRSIDNTLLSTCPAVRTTLFRPAGVTEALPQSFCSGHTVFSQGGLSISRFSVESRIRQRAKSDPRGDGPTRRTPGSGDQDHRVAGEISSERRTLRSGESALVHLALPSRSGHDVKSCRK